MGVNEPPEGPYGLFQIMTEEQAEEYEARLRAEKVKESQQAE